MDLPNPIAEKAMLYARTANSPRRSKWFCAHKRDTIKLRPEPSICYPVDSSEEGRKQIIMSFLPSSPGKTNLPDVFNKYPVRSALVLQFVKKLTLQPNRISQAEADAIFDAGWGEQAFVDVVSICAIQNYLNRLVDGVGVDVESGG